ncbi:MAG TPA: radical SAM family heme chaperone HemW [Candidatus Deferrimicrobiaceae bacterium]|nr:radical SAM family heme chaperone HemW [Candidatus Deferrimicrobiaceae bacterium]
MAGGSWSGPVGSAEHRPRPPVALYLHVPFCRSICPYCDFVVVAGRAATGPANRVAAFTEALVAEIGLRADALDARFGVPPRRPPLESVYLGGGTPSLLPGDAAARVLELVRRRFGLAPDAEITIEVNPGPGDRGDLAGFRRAGVNRVSIGAQSLRPAELRRLGRRHRPADIAETVALARAAGYKSVSLDLLYDVPGQTKSSWRLTLDAALRLEPDHLSLYALTLDDPDAEGLTGPIGDHLPLRAGARRWRRGARAGQDEDRAATMYEQADARLAAARFTWYEISNWSRTGHESRHNLAYWRRQPYEAAGPGAHAFDGVVRRWNAAGLGAYIDALSPGDGQRPRLPPGGRERLDRSTAAFERVALALRTADGVPLASATEPPLSGALAWAIDAGILEVRPPRICLTSRGRLVSNELFARLIT